MKESRLPTLEEIEELTAFLPQLYSEGFVPVEDCIREVSLWSG